jgi:hypothetical protein
MRSLFALSALLIVASTAPTLAQDYPWCARTKGTGPFGDCSFYTYNQCLATVSGQQGYCIGNPRLAYGQYGHDGHWNHGRGYGYGNGYNGW